VRILIIFCVSLVKRGVEYYRSLNECIGALASSYDTVLRRVNVIKNGRERQKMSLPVAAQHRRRIRVHGKSKKSVLDT
jgi:hypothetical protein